MDKQKVALLIKNADIYSNYDERVGKYNSPCRHYIRIPRQSYRERCLVLIDELFSHIDDVHKRFVLHYIERLLKGVDETETERFIDLLYQFQP